MEPVPPALRDGAVPLAAPRRARGLTASVESRANAAGWLAAVALAGHAVPVLLLAKTVLTLPMEAGGLLLAPVVGVPLLTGGVLLLVLAATVPFDRVKPAVAALVVCLGDLFLLASGFRSGWLALGAVMSGAAFGLAVSALHGRVR